MIVLSAGMLKSASSILNRYTVDLIQSGGVRNGQAEFRKSVEEGRIRAAGNFLQGGVLGRNRKLLEEIDSHYGSFVVKMHGRLTPVIQSMITDGQAVGTYTYRDPRDVILSAMDHARRASGNEDYFKKFSSIEASITMVKRMCRNAAEWMGSGLVHAIRYTDLVSNPAREVKKVSLYLGLEVEGTEIEKIIKRHEARKAPGVAQFNTGKLTRFREEMTAEEIRLCNVELEQEILSLGYEI